MTIATQVIEGYKSGDIRVWNGLIANIPTGWVLCDGANGTPDLRSKYLRGADAGQEGGGIGGALTHTHTSHPALSHADGAVGAITATATAAVKIGTAGATGAANSHTHPAPSFTQPSQHAAQGHDSPNHEPPYRTVIWIMKT